MTYSEYKVRAAALISENSEATDADNEAVTLICAVCGKSYAEYLTCRRTSHLTDEEFAVLEEKVRRRAEGEPLQYVIGEWDFHGLPMYCGRGCLIPRFETEMLVERAAKVLPRGGRFLELCVGSGCVSAAILKKRSDISGDGIDISKDALGYAVRNAERHGVSERLHLAECDLAEYVPTDKYDVIVSNPPYVKTADVDAFGDVMKREPRIAFDGGKDGLMFYRTIISRYKEYLLPGGMFIFEAGYDTAGEVAGLLRSAGFTEVAVEKDINGIDRMITGRLTAK